MHSYDAILINGNFCMDFGWRGELRLYGPVPHLLASETYCLD